MGLRLTRTTFRMLAAAAIIGMILGAGHGKAAEQGRRIALVIGNSNYDSGGPLSLPTARNDASDVADALEKLDFTVIRTFDLNWGKFDSALNSFQQEAAKASVALVYYAGHAMHEGAQTYLIPIGAKLPSRQSLPFRLISVTNDIIGKALRDVPLRIVILDAAHDNEIASQFGQEFGSHHDAADARGLGPIPTGDHLLVGYAALPGAVSATRSGRNDPYTEALTRLATESGLELRDVLDGVAAAVRKATDLRQQPRYRDSPDWPGFFLTPIETDEQVWAKIDGSIDPKAFETFALRFPNSRYYFLAIERMNLLSPTAAAKRQAAKDKAAKAQAAKDQAARDQAARDQAARDQAAKDQAARDQEAREKAAKEQAVREQAAKERAARDQAARDQAAREQATRDQAVREQAAKETAIRERAAKEQAVREQIAKEQAIREQAARDQAVREQAARDQAGREQAARDQAVREQAAREQAVREQAARDEAVREQAAREQAVREQAARDQAVREQAARDQAGREQAAKDQAIREQATRDQAVHEEVARKQAEKEQAARDQAAHEQAARERTAKDQAAREQAAKEQRKEQAAKEASAHRARARADEKAEEDRRAAATRSRAVAPRAIAQAPRPRPTPHAEAPATVAPRASAQTCIGCGL